MRFPSCNIPILLILMAGACSPVKTYSLTAEQPVVAGTGMPRPAVIVVSPSPGTEIAGTTQVAPANDITLADNHRSLTMLVGQDLLLNLDTATVEWAVHVDNQNVFSRVKNVTVMRGAQGIYEAVGRGRAVLTAQVDPVCRSSTPACMMPSIFFSIDVTVQ